jgi:hypothetical protein
VEPYINVSSTLSWRGASLSTDFIWNKEELKESIVVLIYKTGHKTYCSHYTGLLQLDAEFYPTFLSED